MEGRRMEDTAPREVEDLVFQAVSMLVSGDVAGLERWTGGLRMSAAQMRAALDDYDAEFVLPSKPEQMSSTDFYDAAKERPWFRVDTFLRTANGPTDLVLQLDVFQDESGRYTLLVNNIFIP
ncbi:hypothetical protein C791_4285 [Amycolatopsis azurea DSM 43854]|uniref:DUF7668 domain-containing protein n=2 Tax=Amycolatopsis azurea DSM 43854 TaxID=1238180 RepID=M2QSD8_9PSEU|nr:hypothetical protein C791_4285 [Amycolatopsis azurea DSM 43854]